MRSLVGVQPKVIDETGATVASRRTRSTSTINGTMNVLHCAV